MSEHAHKEKHTSTHIKVFVVSLYFCRFQAKWRLITNLCTPWGITLTYFILTESALEPILKLLCHSLLCVCVCVCVCVV